MTGSRLRMKRAAEQILANTLNPEKRRHHKHVDVGIWGKSQLHWGGHYL